MNWLALPCLRLAAGAGLVLAAAAFGAWENGNRWEIRYQALELQIRGYETAVATSRAEGLAEGQRLAHDQMDRAQEAANERATELAAIATRAGAQLTGVLRLCPRPGSGPVPAPGTGDRTHAADQPTTGAGLVSGRMDGAGAVLDPANIRDRLNRAEQVAADLRTCMAAWPH